VTRTAPRGAGPLAPAGASVLAIDPIAPPKPGLSDRAEVIENEIPAYRAIYPMAVISLLLGLVSAFSFADPLFLIAGALALIVGLFAEWKIRKLPDVYTGRGLAQAGIAMGLVFSLSSFTMGYVQGTLIKTEASRFGKSLVPVLKKNSLPEALWYRLPPQARKGNSPDDVYKKMRGTAKDPSQFEAHVGQTRALLERVATPGADIHFEDVERYGYDGLIRYGILLYAVHGPKQAGKTDDDEFAMIEIKNDPSNRSGAGWYVSEVVYPYKPKTHVMRAAPTDDGHGHAH
jgi:hypothetical protein